MEIGWGILGLNLAALVALMTAGWLVSLPTRNVTVVPGWRPAGTVMSTGSRIRSE